MNSKKRRPKAKSRRSDQQGGSSKSGYSKSGTEKPHRAAAASRAKTAAKSARKKPERSSAPREPRVEGEAPRAFSWYPGHMVKAKRELENNLKLADAVLLMLDARAAVSTRHPELEVILAQRSTPFLLVLNKADLAQESETERWRVHLKAQGYKVVEMSALKGQGTGPLTPMLDQLEKEINQKREGKGLLPRNVRLMVAGIPNSGKSTLLNRLVGKTRFKAGKKPGLTRGAQWVTVAGRYQLLDTPGILYPRIEGERALATLSAIGSVRRDILPMAQVARGLIKELRKRDRLAELLPEFADISEERWNQEPLEALCEAWGYVDYGGEQTRRAFDRFLNMFAEKAFRITWEAAPVA